MKLSKYFVIGVKAWIVSIVTGIIVALSLFVSMMISPIAGIAVGIIMIPTAFLLNGYLMNKLWRWK